MANNVMIAMCQDRTDRHTDRSFLVHQNTFYYTTFTTHELTSTISLTKIWKPPNITKTNSQSNWSQNELNLVTPGISTFVKFLNVNLLSIFFVSYFVCIFCLRRKKENYYLKVVNPDTLLVCSKKVLTWLDTEVGKVGFNLNEILLKIFISANLSLLLYKYIFCIRPCLHTSLKYLYNVFCTLCASKRRNINNLTAWL